MSNEPKGLSLKWTPPEDAKPFPKEKILYYQGNQGHPFPNPPDFAEHNAELSDFKLDTMYSENWAFLTKVNKWQLNCRAVQSMKYAAMLYLRYEGDGGLLVAGQVVWCMPWGTYRNQEQSLALLPSKDYLRSVVAWFITQKDLIPPPKPPVRLARTHDLHVTSWRPSRMIPELKHLRTIITELARGSSETSWEVNLYHRPEALKGHRSSYLLYGNQVGKW